MHTKIWQKLKFDNLTKYLRWEPLDWICLLTILSSSCNELIFNMEWKRIHFWIKVWNSTCWQIALKYLDQGSLKKLFKSNIQGVSKKMFLKEIAEFLTLKMLPVALVLIKPEKRHILAPLVKNHPFYMGNCSNH